MFKNLNKNGKKLKDKGITLIALIITIVLMLILASVVVTGAINGGLFKYASDAKDEIELASEEEEVHSAYIRASATAKTSEELFEKMRDILNWEGAEFNINSMRMEITTNKGTKYVILEDGKMGNVNDAYLNIEDGSIDISSEGYIQGGGELVPCTGNYTITGSTTQNTIRVIGQGTFNITLKNLNIDASTIEGYCAIQCNHADTEASRTQKTQPTGAYVKINLEGNNKLQGGKCAAALGFAGATPNINGVTNGSTLTIGGKGKLETIGGYFSAGIGSGYTGWNAAEGDANNITINSGTIIAKGGTHGSGIGSSRHQSANNIVINGGTIQAYGNYFGAGIGTTTDNRDENTIANNICINGGKLEIYTEYGCGIGGRTICR